MRLMEPRAAVLLCLSLFAWCRGQDLIKQLTGTNVTFKAVTSENPTEINWFKDSSKIVDLEKDRPPDFYQLAHRVTASLEERTLILKNVSPKDNGVYKAELVVQGKVSYSLFRLQVYDPVCKVVIKNTTQENNVTLQCTCSGEGDRPTKYDWYNKEDRNVGSDSPDYTVSKTKHPQPFTCVARNELSEEKANVIVPALVPPNEGTSTATIVGIVVFVIISIVGVGVGYHFRESISSCFSSTRRLTTDVQGENGDVNEKLNENAASSRQAEDELPEVRQNINA